jgi:hypothetical protein
MIGVTADAHCMSNRQGNKRIYARWVDMEWKAAGVQQVGPVTRGWQLIRRQWIEFPQECVGVSVILEIHCDTGKYSLALTLTMEHAEVTIGKPGDQQSRHPGRTEPTILIQSLK